MDEAHNLGSKILSLCKTTVKIMKYQGLFVHRSYNHDDGDRDKTFKNKIYIKENTSNVTDIDDQMGEYLKINNLFKKSKINKFHLIYCVILTLLKVVFFPINGWYQTFSPQFLNINTLNNSSSYYSLSPFVFILVQISSCSYYLFIFSFPIYFLIINATGSGFYKTVLSYEFIESVIENEIKKFSTPIASKTSKEKVLKLYKIFYLCFFFLLLSILYALIMFNAIRINSRNEQNLPEIAFFVTSFVCYLDHITGFYLISKVIILLQFQIDSFYEYLKILVKHETSIIIQIDIEDARCLYKYLYKHMKIADKWISYFFGLVYITTIPTLCIFLYITLFDVSNTGLLMLVFPNLLISCWEISLITAVAIILHSKVFLINNNHLF